MCEYWGYTCGHTFSKACDLPKLKHQAIKPQISPASCKPSHNLEPCSTIEAQKQFPQFHTTDPSKCCPGYPQQPKPALSPCYACLQSQVALKMARERPRIDAVRAKRVGAGTDNWGYSSRGMLGFGQGGHSNWMDKHAMGNGGGGGGGFGFGFGFGNYLGGGGGGGGGRSMPDRRRHQMRLDDPNNYNNNNNVVLVDERYGLRVLPPGGVNSWPLGAGGMLSVPGSRQSGSSGSVGQGSIHGSGPGPVPGPGFGLGMGTGLGSGLAPGFAPGLAPGLAPGMGQGMGQGPSSISNDSRGGSMQFDNPFVRSQSEGDFIGMRGGLGNGSFGYEAFLGARARGVTGGDQYGDDGDDDDDDVVDEEAARDRYKSV